VSSHHKAGQSCGSLEVHTRSLCVDKVRSHATLALGKQWDGLAEAGIHDIVAGILVRGATSRRTGLLRLVSVRDLSRRGTVSLQRVVAAPILLSRQHAEQEDLP
jgi:hypothetical protein